MGKSQTNVSGSSAQETRYTPTPEEQELNRLQLEQFKAADPYLRDVQKSGLLLSNQLLQGQSNLPGFLSNLPGGISPEVTSDIVRQSLRDIAPSFQQSGLLDSGVRASIEARTAGDIRRASEEFNIGNRLNLLNLALSGQAQVQQPVLGFSQQLSQRLAGLRTVNQTGTFSQKTTQPSNLMSDLISFGGQAATAAALAFCWVAAELFDGWDQPKTLNAWFYITERCPMWFKKLYSRFGERTAKFIRNKPTLKRMIRPLFEWFAKQGEEILNG